MSFDADLPRGSARARLAAALTCRTLRPATRFIAPSPVGVRVSRQIVARSLAAFGPQLPGTRVTPVAEHRSGTRHEVRGEWITARGVTREAAVMLYIHGSGYVLCSPRTHRGLTSRMSAFCNLAVFSVDYRLAPRYPFPTAADDVAAAYRWLLGRGWRADQIVLGGDSAGGHLALDLCLSLLRNGDALPAAQVLLSPVADLTFGLAERREQLRPDPMIPAAGARRLIDLYTQGVDPTHARLAHVIAEHEALPPTLIQAGGREMLAADAHHLARALRASGTRCELEVYPDQMHVFQALPRLIPESLPALRKAARFVEDALPTTRPYLLRQSTTDIGATA